MNKDLFYPAIFHPEENRSYSVFFPDIPGCNTTGNTIEHAYEMAFDALGIVLSYMEDNNESFPSATNPANFELTEGQFVVIIRFNMLEYKQKLNVLIKEGMDDITQGNTRPFSEAISDLRKRRK